MKGYRELLRDIKEQNEIMRKTKSNVKYQQAKEKRKKLIKKINDLHSYEN